MFNIQPVADHALLQAVERPLFWIAVIFLLIVAVTVVLVCRQLRRERAPQSDDAAADAPQDAPH